MKRSILCRYGARCNAEVAKFKAHVADHAMGSGDNVQRTENRATTEMYSVASQGDHVWKLAGSSGGTPDDFVRWQRMCS